MAILTDMAPLAGVISPLRLIKTVGLAEIKLVNGRTATGGVR